MTNIFDRMVADDDSSNNRVGNVDTDPIKSIDDKVTDGTIRTASEVKQVTQELLKRGYIEETESADLFRSAVAHERAILAALEPLDLILRLDSLRGVAFLAVAQASYEKSSVEENWSHPLVRRQRLTLEQSLLIALLRQTFVMYEQETGIGQGAATIAVDELLPQFLAYFGDTGSDAKNESRLLCLLDQLKTYGIVSEVDKKQELIIRPLITYLANPESLMALLQLFREHRQNTFAPEREDQ